jgi:CDP-6-deoxy-D-xylo-4-hexulose-3-dehydrase
MTTIEGGVVCTNNTELYELMRLKRSHGMAREASPEVFRKYAEENPDIDKMFLFMTDGYNFRNHEVCAVLGLSQLKRLDKNIQIRRQNYERFCLNILNISGFNVPQYQKGNSSFSFPIITCKDNINIIKDTLQKNKIEYRPIISGNLLRHPAFNKYQLCTEKENPNVEILHKNGLYVGNSQFVNYKKVDKLIEILKGVNSNV